MTDDYLGFVHHEGVCAEPVHLWAHDEPEVRPAAPHFQDWAADLARRQLEVT